MRIPKQVEWILLQLEEHGYEGYAVGGCVRDTLLGREPEDWDITTSARPEEVRQVFARTIDTGLQHGTVTVMLDHTGYEVTTYRIDGEYEDGRHPKEVSFTRDLKEDLKRRDFTINAMALSLDGELVDLFGGREDLKAGVVRCVGEPAERFSEDALRLLRAIRFAAQLDFTIEEQTKRALCEEAPRLSRVSRERVQAELTKTLLSTHPERICMVWQAGMAPYVSESFSDIFTEAGGREPETVRRLEERLRLAAALPAVRAVRWAAFLLEMGEDRGGRMLKEFKLDNETIRCARVLIRWFPVRIADDPRAVRQAMSAMDDGLFDCLLEMKEILDGADGGHAARLKLLAEEIRGKGDCIRLKDLAVTGTDLIAAGAAPGPALGQMLKELFAHVLEYPEDNVKEILLKAASDRD